MEKLWMDCSKEERDEVRKIELERRALKLQFQSGAISHRKYSYRLTRLQHKLEEVWDKYDE